MFRLQKPCESHFGYLINRDTPKLATISVVSDEEQLEELMTGREIFNVVDVNSCSGDGESFEVS